MGYRVNILETRVDHDDILSALFGELKLVERRQRDAVANERVCVQQRSGGIWGHADRPRNKSIAALWLFTKVAHDVMPTMVPIMVLNPFRAQSVILQNLPFVDHYLPSKDGLALKHLGIERSRAELKAWRENWPLRQ